MPISRSYRPHFFKDVTGQQHITETLRKEVESGILGHAFLFSGPRGVGKTTTARIFAKALLSERTDKGEPDPNNEAVREIDEGRCIDLIELDAASHTGVDNIREVVIEHVRFPPARWKRKVYIIDECHMLSASAWNALLKTLEEPPEYAFFILATTELHKVPETIKSRCQRFEFKRIAPQPLIERIRFLAKEEGVKVADDVCDLIVRSSDGCVRDAESLFEQLVSLGEKNINRDIAELILPHSDIPSAAALLGVCAKRATPDALSRVRELLLQGISPAGLLDDLLVVTRQVLTAEDPEEHERLGTLGVEGEAILGLLGRFTRAELADIALLLIERRRDVKSGVDPVFVLELAVVAISGAMLPHASTETATYTAPGPASPPTHDLKAQTNTKGDESKQLERETAGGSDTPLAPPDIHDVRVHWNAIVQKVGEENRSLPFILKITRPDRVEGRTVILRFEYIFHKEKIIGDGKIKMLLERCARTVLKNEAILFDGEVSPSGDPATSDERTRADVVSRVLNTFGGSVVE